MTPATWSMVQVFLNDAMATASIPPYVGYGRIGGRIYLNVSVMKTLSAGRRGQRAAVPHPDRGGLRPAARRPRDPAGTGPPAPCCGRSSRWPLHVLGEARRDAKQLDGYLADHPALCDRRRAEIAAVDDRARAGRAVGRRDRARVPPGQLDAVRGHPLQRRVLRHHPEAAAAAGRGRRGQRAHRRPGSRGRASWPASACSTAWTSSTAGRDRPGHLQPALRPPRPARVRDLHARGRVRTRTGSTVSWPQRERSGVDHRDLLAGQEDKPGRCLAELERRPPAAGLAAASPARPVGEDRPRPRARPQRGDPLLLGAAGLRRSGRAS